MFCGGGDISLGTWSVVVALLPWGSSGANGSRVLPSEARRGGRGKGPLVLRSEEEASRWGRDFLRLDDAHSMGWRSLSTGTSKEWCSLCVAVLEDELCGELAVVNDEKKGVEGEYKGQDSPHVAG